MFDQNLADTFQVDVSTKVHRPMRHVNDHMKNLGSIMRYSYEENEYMHIDFKQCYNNTNRHMSTIAQQFLQSGIPRITIPDAYSQESFKTEEQSYVQHAQIEITNLWSNMVRASTQTGEEMGRRIPPNYILRYLLSHQTSGVYTWCLLKRVS